MDVETAPPLPRRQRVKIQTPKPLRRSKRIMEQQSRAQANNAEAEEVDEFMAPQDLDYSLSWDEFDLNDGAKAPNERPNQVHRNEEGEPIWHTMPAGLEALSCAPHSCASSKSKNDPDILTLGSSNVPPVEEQVSRVCRCRNQGARRTWHMG